VDDIKMDLRDIEWDRMDLIDSAQDRDRWRVHVNTVMKVRVPLNAGKFLSSCTTGFFSGRAQLYEVSLKLVENKVLSASATDYIYRTQRSSC
jgi:hypothetical protein